MRDAVLESFTRRWEHISSMTTAFATVIPDEFWEATPHSGFAPFSRQLRHVVCVRGVYNDGLRTKRMDFSRKHDFYKGSLTRRELIDALSEKHAELLVLLAEVPEDLDRPQIDFFGNQVSYLDYLYGYVQHEAIHHGQWSLYAAVAGYETPEPWRLQWGLGAGEV